MAITKKLIHFDTYANFNSQKLSANKANTQYTTGVSGTVTTGTPNILYKSICYIKDVKKFWTHGTLYDCSELVSGTNIKTLDGESIVGSGDLRTKNIKFKGIINIATSSASSNVNAIADDLEEGEVALCMIGDSSGSLPSDETYVNVNSSLLQTLNYFFTTDATAANVGDILMISKQKYLLLTRTVCKIIPLNDAKAANSSHSGTAGLMTPWDKAQVNKIDGIQTSLNTAASELNRGNKKQVYNNDGYNIDQCLNAGIYLYGRTGRTMDSNSSDEYYIVDVDTRYNRSDSLYYVTQKVYSVNYPNRAFERLVTTSAVDNYNGTYSSWVQISYDSYTKSQIDDILADYATQEYVDNKVADLVGSAPDTLNTLEELSEALRDNEDIVDVLEAAIAEKADKDSVPTKLSELTNDSGYVSKVDDSEVTNNAQPFVTDVAAMSGTLVVQKYNGTVGSTTTPIYMNNGVPTECESLNTKVDVSEYSPESTEQLISFRTADNAESDTAWIEKVKGSTVVWNHRVNTSKLVSNSYITIDDNIFTFNGTTSVENQNYRITKTGISVPSSHKLLLLTDAPDYVDFRLEGALSWRKNLIKDSIDGELYDPVIKIGIGASETFNFSCYIKLYDLTQMFGAGNEPTTIEEFNERKPVGVDEYAYNEGELISLNGSVQGTGFNQLNLERTLGTVTSGRVNTVARPEILDESLYFVGLSANNYYTKANVTDYSITKDSVTVTQINGYGVAFPIRCLPDTTYSIQLGEVINFGIGFYDSLGNYISYIVKTSGNTFTPPEGATWMNIVFNYNGTYTQPCISIVKTDSDSKEYEPYKGETRSLHIDEILDYDGNQLFPYGLLSAGSVYDEITPTKAIKRVGVLSLSELSYYKTSDTNYYYSEGVIYPNYNAATNVIVCSYYNTTTWNKFVEEYNGDRNTCIALWKTSDGSSRVNILDDSIEDVAALQTFLSEKNVMLYYELAEPIEIYFDETLRLDYKVDSWGTEQIVSDVPTTPMKADIIYKYNTTGRIESNTARLDIVENDIKEIVEDVNAIEVPTKVSELENDSGYITKVTKGTNATTGIPNTFVTDVNVSGNAVSAQKYTGTVGSSTEPIYLKSGIPTKITSYGEANLSWGGKNWQSGYGPIDAALVDVLGANRFDLLPADCITVEYSRDGGTTWLDYEITVANKINLVSQSSGSTGLYVGKSTTEEPADANCKLRVIINSRKPDSTSDSLYTQLRKYILLVSTTGSSGCTCTIKTKTVSDYNAGNDTWAILKENIPISGWTGYNVINTDNRTFGGSGSTHTRELMFEFSITSHDIGTSGTWRGLNILKIFAYGGTGWVTPSNTAASGHLYTYDSNQKAIFPAVVNAVGGLQENGTNLSSKYLGINAAAKSISDGTVSYTSSELKTALDNVNNDINDLGLRIESAEGKFDDISSNSDAITQMDVRVSALEEEHIINSTNVSTDVTTASITLGTVENDVFLPTEIGTSFDASRGEASTIQRCVHHFTASEDTVVEEMVSGYNDNCLLIGVKGYYFLYSTVSKGVLIRGYLNDGKVKVTQESSLAVKYDFTALSPEWDSMNIVVGAILEYIDVY